MTLRDRVSNQKLISRLDVDSISSIVTKNRQRWYAHVQRKDDVDWVQRCTECEVVGHVAEEEAERLGRSALTMTW